MNGPDILKNLLTQATRADESVWHISNELRTTAIREALSRVHSHHPEAATLQEQFDLAVQLAVGSLRRAAQILEDEGLPAACGLKDG